jgi:endonuclease YncB( thermonuclease family)
MTTHSIATSIHSPSICIVGGGTWEDVMRTLLIFVLLLLTLTPSRANDADTLTINGITYRFDGIDAPELDQSCIDEFGDLYPCGRVALKALQQFIAERTVHCEDLGPDPKYPQRSIGQCSVDGIDLHGWLVKEGWALNFEPYAHGRFKNYEREAREGRFGIWKGCFVNPQDFRRWNKRGASLIGPSCPPDARTALFPDHAQMPRGCEIKAKYALRGMFTGHRGIYHVPGCGSYRRTSNPDLWFCSEAEAIEAGFRHSLTCWIR